MNIADKTSRIITGEDSQHSTRSAPEQVKPPAIVRLRSLLRGKPESARAAETAYFTEPEAGGTIPAPSTDPNAAPGRSSASEAAEVPESYEAMTVPALQDEIRSRNEMYYADDTDKAMHTTGRKAELIKALSDDDEYRRELQNA